MKGVKRFRATNNRIDAILALPEDFCGAFTYFSLSCFIKAASMAYIRAISELSRV
jgi:hypothetical protein